MKVDFEIIPQQPEKSEKGDPMSKVLLFDIETAPNLGYVWGKWEQNVIENTKDWYMLSFAYKWLGEKTVKAYSLPNFKGYRRNREDDTLLVQKLWELIGQADIVIAHNGDEFDIKKANTRFLVSGLNPPRPYKTIDTKKVAKKYFRFDSNKLEELARHLGVKNKLSTGGFSLWKGCMAGDPASWKKMVRYNKQDVTVLEEVYLKLLPWIQNFPVTHPDNGTCPNCDSARLQKRGHRYTRTSRFPRLQCQGCGAWTSGKSERLVTTLTTRCG